MPLVYKEVEVEVDMDEFDDDELIELLHSKIRTLPGVVETETFVYLKLHKQLYNWGTR